MQQYHSRLGTPQISIPECSRLRHSSGIPGEAAPFTAGYVLAKNRSLGTTEICNPVQNDILDFYEPNFGKLATHYERLIPGQTHHNSIN